MGKSARENMTEIRIKLSATFGSFFESERASGIALIVCTIVALFLANSVLSPGYQELRGSKFAGLTVEHWVNDALMAVFFLYVGLELERELYVGELSNFKNALLPIVAAIGGISVPALMHFSLNAGTPTQAGAGIPMATDIAFALGALALLGERVPPSLKIFLTALAVMDDLGAVIVIAVFYTSGLSVIHLVGALLIFAVMVVLNRYLRVMALWPYVVGGVLMWYMMRASGVHPTIAGVLLAFAIPFSARGEDERSPSYRLEHFLNKPVAFFVLPLFALTNTGIAVGEGWHEDLFNTNSIGIMAGLIFGKPLGIALFTYLAIIAGICRLPSELNWRHIFGAGFLGGIGFTMAIFITHLAFHGSAELINASKMSILLASLIAGLLGIVWLRFTTDSNQHRKGGLGREAS